MDFCLEYCRLSCELFCVIVAREYDFNINFLAGILAYELLFESRDELSRTELELIVLCASAAECLAVNCSCEVDDDSVAVLGLAVLNSFHSCLALLYSLELFLDFLVADLCLYLLDLKALVVLYFDLREYLNGTGKHYRLVLLDLRSFKRRLGNNLDVHLLESFVIILVEQSVDSLIPEDIVAIVILDDLSRRFALAETVYREFASVVKICLVYSILEFLCRKLDVEFYDSVLFRNLCSFHVLCSSVVCLLFFIDLN